MTYDIIVIGGGIIGCAVADRLARSRVSVCLLEGGDDVAVGATRANSGIVHAGYDCEPGTLKARFNVRGNPMVWQLAEELGVPALKCGSLVAAPAGGEDGIAELKRRADLNGVRAEVLTREQALKIEPMLAEGVVSALYAPEAGVVSPYQLILHNQRYYLMACNERWGNMTYYRLDRITDMRLLDEPATPLRSVDGYESGINYKEIATALPYMFTDKPEHVEFLCDGWVLDHAVDWFGDNARISRQGEKYKVSVRVSPMAMEYWAMQYLNAVEVILPASLRKKIAANLHAALEKYN